MDTARNKRLESSNPVGRVVIDGRGRNVWQWDDDQLDSTSIVLKRLDNAALALEPTRKLSKLGREHADERDSRAAQGRNAPAKARTSARGRSADITSGELRIEQTFELKLGGGFDPYNRS